MFIALGVYSTHAVWPRDTKVRAGLALLTLAGIGKVVSGLNPANVDFTLHSLGAFGIPIGDIGPRPRGSGVPWQGGLDSCSGRSLWEWRDSWGSSTSWSGNSLSGLWERVGSYPIIVWCVVMGYCFLKWSREAETK